MKHPVRTLLGLACMAGAAWASPPRVDDVLQFARWCVRPATLPFAWRALDEAGQRGDAAEGFARADQLMRLLPSWTDGYGVFAYRFALAPGHGTGTARGEAARERLERALAWLEQARPRVGRREAELLQVMAFLPEVASRVEPELARLLQPGGGAAKIAAGYMAQLEQRYPGPAVQEQRTFFAPQLAGALLGAGQRAEAIAELRRAVERAGTVRDRDLAREWAARVDEAARWLAGDRTVDRTAVQNDPRMAPLVPWLD